MPVRTMLWETNGTGDGVATGFTGDDTRRLFSVLSSVHQDGVIAGYGAMLRVDILPPTGTSFINFTVQPGAALGQGVIGVVREPTNISLPNLSQFGDMSFSIFLSFDKTSSRVFVNGSVAISNPPPAPTSDSDTHDVLLATGYVKNGGGSTKTTDTRTYYSRDGSGDGIVGKVDLQNYAVQFSSGWKLVNGAGSTASDQTTPLGIMPSDVNRSLYSELLIRIEMFARAGTFPANNNLCLVLNEDRAPSSYINSMITMQSSTITGTSYIPSPTETRYGVCLTPPNATAIPAGNHVIDVYIPSNGNGIGYVQGGTEAGIYHMGTFIWQPSSSRLITRILLEDNTGGSFSASIGLAVYARDYNEGGLNTPRLIGEPLPFFPVGAF